MIKVIDNALRGIPFTNLGVGATFKYGDNYYLVTEYVNAPNGDTNAVRLDNGVLTYFDSGDEVVPFNCELIIL